ncbi:DUF4192 family protein [Amnibacterium kyonggiense]|uniref:Uncharacterized protein DUF4192 n=1 Tax=Amnibacterium kyonggiense TaxID=595671 RepID=A0A4R7FEB3_9MICO|nr:DUF4192 family protein [Amnibacterium kyonggiense]TDS75693.1 uncharacterized protein DUF4192 [Amnibacterium kyonggiense]
MSQKRARALRAQSPDPVRRPVPRVVQASGPAGVLRFVPDLLPVDPEDSLVLVLFRRMQGRRSRTHGAMRVDLRHTEDEGELAAWAEAVLGGVLRVDGVTGVAIAAYTPETFAPSGRPPAAVQVRVVARQAERMGLEVLDRFCVGADAWGSLDDPMLPRGGRPLAQLEPDGPRLRPRPPVPAAGWATAADRRRFRADHAAWWGRPDGPGGAVHGVPMGPGDAADRRSPMDRYRWGVDLDQVVDLVEAALLEHGPGDAPCACRALLASLAERPGLIPMLLGQIGWGRAFGRELWTAFAAPAGRQRTGERLREAIGGGKFPRPDVARLETALAAFHEAAAVAESPRTAAGVEEALAWLHWARGAASTAGGHAERALVLDDDRDLAPVVLDRVEAGILPLWAYRADPRKPDRFERLLAAPERTAG